jgi:preprotein translocase subunit Sec61beta
VLICSAGLYTDESPGLKVDPVVVLVLSLVFIFSVVALHSTPSPQTPPWGVVSNAYSNFKFQLSPRLPESSPAKRPRNHDEGEKLKEKGK